MSRLIKPKKNGANLENVTVNQRRFVEDLLAAKIFNPTAVCKAMGYKQPSVAANRMMKNKAIARALGKAMRERGERCQLKADNVLNYLKIALFFNPLSLFKPTEDGKWMIDDLDKIPEEIGRLIEKIETKTKETEEGTETTFKIEFIAHSTVLPLAMKHLGLLNDKIETEITTKIDWSSLLANQTGSPKKLDRIEQTILDVESKGVEE